MPQPGRDPGGDRLAIEVLDAPEAIGALGAEWDDLLEDSAQLVFFLRRSWADLWWRTYAPRGARLWLVACRDGGRLVGLVPFYRRRRGAFALPALQEILSWGRGSGR